MLAFVLRRLSSGLALVVAIAVAAFFLLYAAAGDTARQLLGLTATQQAVDQKARELGTDRPLTTQFFDWAGHALQGDLGSSWFSGQPVLDAISSRLPVTLSVVLGATLLTAVLGTVLGVVAARRGGWADVVVQLLAVIGFAIPGFILAVGLAIIFAIQLGWFAPTGYVNLSDSPTGWLSSVTLPVIALSIPGVAGIAAQVRNSVQGVLRLDWVRTLRSRGLSERRVVYTHVLRNAAGPALSVLGLQFVGLLGGAVFVEQIFVLPGIGQILVSATAQGDVPLVMGLVLVTAVLVVLVNLLVDLLQGWLNPKVRG